MVGTPDRPDVIRAACGGPDSTFKVIATVTDSDECPSDVDSYYATRNTLSDTSSTLCMDVDWVLGQCMSVDPDGVRDPARVDCKDDSQPNRKRATQILQGIVDADQCRSGMGYSYTARGFTVCVDDVA